MKDETRKNLKELADTVDSFWLTVDKAKAEAQAIREDAERLRAELDTPYEAEVIKDADGVLRFDLFTADEQMTLSYGLSCVAEKRFKQYVEAFENGEHREAGIYKSIYDRACRMRDQLADLEKMDAAIKRCDEELLAWRRHRDRDCSFPGCEAKAEFDSFFCGDHHGDVDDDGEAI